MPNDNHTEPAPEDLNYPETLRIKIASPEDAFDEAIDAASAADDGDQTDAVVSFESADGLRQLLTDRRLELLRSLMNDSAESITALAERLGRSYSVVHDDVELLAEHGLIKFHQDSQSKRPFVPYETIKFDVTIRGAPSGNDTEAPV
jgi:predicted transcriptional regulator